MRQCLRCGKKLGLLELSGYCRACNAASKAEEKARLRAAEEERQRLQRERSERMSAIVGRLKSEHALSEDDAAFLRTWDKPKLVELYGSVLKSFQEDTLFSEPEVVALQTLQNALGLSHDDIGWEERVAPYYYAFMIRDKAALPNVHLSIEGAAPVILRTGETIHFATRKPVVLREQRTVSLGYAGGSHGVSFPIPGLKGVRYRVGSHRGHVMKEERWVDTARGFLLITNQRLFLHPIAGSKPVSLPLKKLLSYEAYGNGLSVYKEGREKGYFFAMTAGQVEVAGLCLSFLTRQEQGE